MCYRAWTVEQARALNLTGWVRNRNDGSVEAVFCGEDTKVNAMIEACRSGPVLARVDSIDATPAEDEDWDTFQSN